MKDAMQIAATGMQTQQRLVETIAHNMSNINTQGFKRSKVSFSELVAGPGSVMSNATTEPSTGWSASLAGVRLQATTLSFASGELRQTDQALDLAILGPGFLEVDLGGSQRAFLHGGSLKVNEDGLLCGPGGQPLVPSIQVPADAERVMIQADGRIQAQTRQGNTHDIGKLEVTTFASPEFLEPMGDNLFLATERSGKGQAHASPADANITLKQGYLEAANVKMVDEMVSLMLAQRAYEANVKVIQAADEMQGLVNALRK